MTEKDFADIVRLIRRVPLHNMDEAEAVAVLLQKYGSFVNDHLIKEKVAVEPTTVAVKPTTEPTTKKPK